MRARPPRPLRPPRRSPWTLALAALVTAAAGCESPPFVIDPFPIGVDLGSGALLALAAVGEPAMPRDVVVDTATAVTILDEGGDGVRRATIELFHRTVVGGAEVVVPRARFIGISTLLAPVGSVGPVGGSERPVAGIIGGDVLTQVAVRLDPARSEVRFFPDIAGSDAAHATSCDAVMRFTAAGGGDFELGSAMVAFVPSRVVLGACLVPDPPACLQRPDDASLRCTGRRGSDALFVVATGVPTTLLSRSAWRRATGASDADAAALPRVRVFLPGGPPGGEELSVTTLPLVALAPHRADRGPCEDVHVARLQPICPTLTTTAAPCTCPNESCGCDPDDEGFCTSVGVLELGAGVEVALLPDTHPLLQGLRNELRPDVADIDGLLGMGTLNRLVVSLDYPNGRVIGRCAEPQSERCRARPAVTSTTERTQLRDEHRCLVVQ